DAFRKAQHAFTRTAMEQLTRFKQAFGLVLWQQRRGWFARRVRYTAQSTDRGGSERIKSANRARRNDSVALSVTSRADDRAFGGRIRERANADQQQVDSGPQNQGAIAAQCRVARGFDDEVGMQVDEVLDSAADPQSWSTALPIGMSDQCAYEADVVKRLHKVEHAAGDGSEADQSDAHLTICQSTNLSNPTHPSI